VASEAVRAGAGLDVLKRALACVARASGRGAEPVEDCPSFNGLWAAE
jgi:hypothetical protein